MPYKTNDDLPESIRNSLPSKAQDIWREVFNKTGDDKDEEAARKIAWGAVKKSYEKQENGTWIQKKEFAETHEFEAEVFTAGTHDGDVYTDEDLDDMVKNFGDLKGVIKPPIKLSHWNKMHKGPDGQPNLGVIKGLRKAGDKVLALFSEVPGVLYQAIKKNRYTRVSPELYWGFKHNGKKYNRVLSAVGILGADIPVVKGLADLQVYLSQSTDPAGSGSFDQVKTYSLETDENGNLINETGGDDVEKQELEAKLKEEKEAREKAEAEAKKYAEERDSERKKAAEGKKKSRSEEFKTYCEDQVKAGKMLPAQRDVLVKDLDLHVYSEDNGFAISFEQFKEYSELTGKVLDTTEHGKAGKGKEATPENVAEEVAVETKKYMAEHPTVSYVDASDLVLRENPDLAKRYAFGEEE